MTYDPPSLLELAGRTIKSRNIPYYPCDLPANLLRYLDLASKCPNPKCAGKSPPIQTKTHFRMNKYPVIYQTKVMCNCMYRGTKKSVNMFFFLLFPACLFSFNYIWVTVLHLLYGVQVRLKQVPDRPVESGFVFRIYRRLLWFMCAPDQICGLLWKVSAAPHALPVLARVHLSVQLQPAEWCGFWGREQCACVPPAAGASWIAQHGGATDALARHSVFSLSLCSTLIQRLSWHTYTKKHILTHKH